MKEVNPHAASRAFPAWRYREERDAGLQGFQLFYAGFSSAPAKIFLIFPDNGPSTDPSEYMTLRRVLLFFHLLHKDFS
jgi:hypothetical protein